MADRVELARRFGAAAMDHRARAPFHAELCRIIADEPGIAALLGAAPEEQQLPVLLLAAIHDQVLADPSCELAAWYPTVAATPRRDDVRAAFVAHCHVHASSLVATVATRTTQTNEVGRCGLLLPALGLLADEVGALAWVDVGASGGLNLQLDRFTYEYRPGGTVGDPSPVRLVIDLRGPVPVPPRIPTIVHRLGLDRDPVDLADPVEARWLRACIWPDQADRLRRLDAAIELARDEPYELRRGDAVDDLAAVVDELVAAAHPVVTTSWVLNYLPAERRTDFVRVLDGIGGERDLSWVYAESPTEADGLPFDPSVAGRSTTAVGLVTWRAGVRRARHLGVAHPHGFWMHGHVG